MNGLLLTYLIDEVTPYAKWTTISLVGALVVLAAVVAIVAAVRKDKSVFGILKKAVYGFTVYALVLGVFLLALDVGKHYDADYLDGNYVDRDIIGFVLVPLIATLSLVLISAAILFILNLKKSDKLRLATLVSGIVCGAALIVAATLIAVYFSKHVSGDGYYTADGNMFNQPALYVSAAALVGLTIAAAFAFDKENFTLDSKTIARAGICLAISFALSFIKLFRLPQGGSITLGSALPIMIFAYAYGMKKGLLVGLTFGLMQSIQDPFIIHPAQFFLDYPIAFTMIGYAGAFKSASSLDKLPQVKFALGAITACSLRFFAHFLSGVFAFGAYAVDAGQNIIIYSLAYNSFVFADAAIAIVLGVVIMSYKSFRNVLGS